MHKERNGVFVTCHQCKIGNHEECYNIVELDEPVIYCHCKCQPGCERPECTRRKFHTPRKGWSFDDPRWEQ